MIEATVLSTFKFFDRGSVCPFGVEALGVPQGVLSSNHAFRTRTLGKVGVNTAPIERLDVRKSQALIRGICRDHVSVGRRYVRSIRFPDA